MTEIRTKFLNQNQSWRRITKSSNFPKLHFSERDAKTEDEINTDLSKYKIYFIIQMVYI